MANDTVSGGAAAGLVIAFFLLGIVLGCSLVVFIPALYRILDGWKDALAAKLDPCRRSICKCESRETKHVIEVNDVTYDKQTTGNYDEIDELKTQTAPNGLKGKFRKKKKKSEKMFDPELANTRRQDYEDVQTNPEYKRFSNHNYCIVEPSTCKRLPVKIVTSETLVSDTNHVYFVLEPGSDKVTPIFTPLNQDRSSIIVKKDHTYFVLESAAETDPDNGHTEPYAVNDVSGDHKYFVLEKVHHN